MQLNFQIFCKTENILSCSLFFILISFYNHEIMTPGQWQACWDIFFTGLNCFFQWQEQFCFLCGRHTQRFISITKAKTINGRDTISHITEALNLWPTKWTPCGFPKLLVKHQPAHHHLLVSSKNMKHTLCKDG